MAKEITTVFDYLDWRGDISFSQLPPCEVDSLVFSLLSYIDFDGIVPPPDEIKGVSLLAAAKKFIKKYKEDGKPDIGFIIPKDVVVLLAKAAKTKRFGEVLLSSYVNKICDGEEKQFSAITFVFKNTEGADELFVVFRGTDDTIVGWKENFNMSFMQPVPSQLEAAEYLSDVASNTFGEITVGGHSKGGNLAVYAAVSAPERVKKRINTVYNLDGPGFNIDFLASEEYRIMRDRIRTIVPHSSIVGMLLEHEESYEVISSSQTGLLQHNGFFWHVLGGSFVHLESVSGESRLIDETLKKWLSEMTPEQRKDAVDSIYDSLTQGKAKTLSDLNADKRQLVKAWNTMSDESRTFVRKCISLLIKNNK